MANNNEVPLNPNLNVAPGQEHYILIAHDVNRPIREYTSPNLYDFNLGIAYPYLAIIPSLRWSRPCFRYYDYSVVIVV